jgi:hypothetical protein
MLTPFGGALKIFPKPDTKDTATSADFSAVRGDEGIEIR